MTEEEIISTPAVELTAAEVSNAKKQAAKGKKKTVRQIPQGRAYVHASFNNTIVSLTDANGNVIAWSSAGNCGFKGPKKATPYAASMIVKKITDKAEPYGLKDLYVFVTGIGNGRDAAVRALNTSGFNVLSIKDTTPVPHNGCRPRRARRM
ncbi:MAG: 30S ribosomal protein S11 [Patescibacteria group bacterium]|jgi:small subunit ribosomal protein S11